MDSEEHVVDLIPAYALDCLDGKEKLLVADHLKVCKICEIELQAYLKVIDQLALGAKDCEPPPQLKDRIIQQTVQGRSTEPGITPKSSWNQAIQALRGNTPAWAMASLVLVLALGISNAMLWRQLNVHEVSSPASLMTIELKGTDLSPDATGMLVISRDGEYGTLVVDGLPLLDLSSQYQLWLINNSQRTSEGVFSVGEGGYGILRVSSSMPLISFLAFGVTVEPAGGSSAPTGDKVLGGQL